ncbi:hypothetical protein D3C72_1620840 [compost metagenome]
MLARLALTAGGDRVPGAEVRPIEIDLEHRSQVRLFHQGIVDRDLWRLTEGVAQQGDLASPRTSNGASDGAFNIGRMRHEFG